jgi:hypothetical protein
VGDALFAQWVGGVLGFCVLNAGSIVWGNPWVGSVLWLGSVWVCEPLEGLFNISGHGDGDMAFFVVPLQGHATELGCCHVYSDFIVLALCGL